jgi:tetratricopeptide (TPR) repeat protein
MSDYFDLGTHSRRITTTSTHAQTWFDRGLAWCYGYNHDEAVRCFEKAAKADPNCAMAWWGMAYAAGPNYNKQWKAFDVVELERSLAAAHKATAEALKHASSASPVEKALIAPLALRYPANDPGQVTPIWNDDYATAMRKVYQAHPADLDVAALFAEAIMNRTPWQLWDIAIGKPAEGADTLEAIEVLEKAMRAPGGDSHPGLLHMYVHLMEMSPTPERALKAGDRLRHVMPDAGHLLHMPTHIDVLCGHYPDVVEWNDRAIKADRKYLAKEGALNFYSLYRCHDFHFKIYGAMFMGQLKPALEAADEMAATLTEDLLTIESPPMADWLESFAPMKMHVLIRFGKWGDIISTKLPENRALYCVTTAMIRYARAVAFAASGNIKAAEAEARHFAAAVAKVPPTRYLFNNTALDILAIAAEMMKGEIAYRQGRHAEAFAHLRKSVELDDNLPYDEPWGWMQPTRHALGALLLEQGKIGEAEAIYRADLGLNNALRRACQHPDNVWSLRGYHECLMKLGKKAEAALIKPRLDIALARTDVPVTTSCFCRLEAVA